MKQPKKVTKYLVICLFFPLVLLFVSQNFLYTSIFIEIVIFFYFIFLSFFYRFKYPIRYLWLHLFVFITVTLSVTSAPSTSFFALSFFLLFPLCEFICEYFTRNRFIFFNASFFIYWLTILYTCFLYFFYPNWFLDIRFSGFSPTPTTFTTYLLLVFVIYFFTETSRIKLLISVLPTLYFVLISQTRISMILLAMILAIRFFHIFVSSNLKLCFSVVLILAMSLYPISTMIGENVNFTNRYENKTDYSRLTRLALFNNQLDALANENIFQLTFGNGIRSANKVGFGYLEDDIDQHNDFFTLVYEYGILFFLIFIFLLCRLCNSPFALAVLAIYFFSFYHNML